MILEMLQEEVEHTRSRTRTAIYQVESLREGIESYGVKLPDEAEIEALIRKPSLERPQTPPTPTQTPPTQLFQELLLDMLDRSPTPSSSSSRSDPSQLSVQPQINLSPDHTPCSPVLRALDSSSAPSAFSDQVSSRHTPPTPAFLTPVGGDSTSEIGE